MPTGHRFLATDLHQFVVSLFTHLGSTRKPPSSRTI